MKIFSRSPLLIFMLLSLSANGWAAIEQSQLPEIVAVEANQASEAELRKSVDEKQLKAIQLINAVGTYANDRYSSDLEKDEASHAYGGFIARFQGIREDREALERKEIMADYKTLQNYSQRLERLITEIKTFLK